MERLTRWNDKTESAELTAYDDYDWEQFWSKEVLDIVDFLRLQPAFDMLAEYEDLEEQLESVYGEHSGLLKTAVKSLVKHEGVDFGKAYKARLLTDEDVDKWEEYKDLEEQGRLIVLPCKIGDTVYSLEFGEIKEYVATAFKILDGGVFVCHNHLFVGVFGASVFRTKEEAEKALVEMGE